MLNEKAAPYMTQTTIDDEIFDYAQQLGFGDIHFKFDAKTGLIGIIAIHNTTLGPSLGGCRLYTYPSIKDAIRDVMRLAQGMSYKSAITGLRLGGGKSVLIKPAHIANRVEYFEAFGRFINELNGRYITAVDSGTSPADMDAVAHTTKYVSCTTSHGDPSPFTAKGIRFAIEAAVKFKRGSDSLDGLHVAIQGVGNVGYYLARELSERGARFTITDKSQAAIDRCVREFNCPVIATEDIHKIACDVYSPCALGAIINDQTIPEIQAPMIIGAANNQLASPRHGLILHQRGVLYGPDYVVNAGGVVHAGAEYLQMPLEAINNTVHNIYNASLEIFERSAKENRPTSEIADLIAEEKLGLR